MEKTAAEAAIAEIDGCELDGRIIQVNEARARGSRDSPPKSDEDEASDDSYDSEGI